MHRNKIIIAGLMANFLAACSSPPKLSEPEGDWISFDAPRTIAPSAITEADTAPVRATVTSGRYIQPAPQPVSSPARPSMLTSLVKGDGENMPLYMAARTIVPPSENVKLAPEVAQNFRSKVSWTGNDQWPFVLQKMLQVNGLEAVIDTNRHEVIIQYGQKAATPAKVPAVKPAVTVKTSSAAAVTLPTAATAGKHSDGMLKPPTVPVATQGVPVTTNAKPAPVINRPVPAMPVMKTWKIDKGVTLKAGYSAWVAKESCPAGKGKWLVRWDTDTDYPIDYPLLFNSSSFEDATSQLFDLYRKAQTPLYVSGYRNQCLIVISDRK